MLKNTINKYVCMYESVYCTIMFVYFKQKHILTLSVIVGCQIYSEKIFLELEAN